MVNEFESEDVKWLMSLRVKLVRCRQVNWNVFKFRLTQPRRMIRETGRTVRGRLLHAAVSSFADNLSLACDNLSVDCDGGWTQSGLLAFTARTMFDAIFNTVFGRDDTSQFNSQLAYHNFQASASYYLPNRYAHIIFLPCGFYLSIFLSIFFIA